MAGPLIAIVGDITSSRVFDPPMTDPAAAKQAAEELGTELAKKGARLLVYGGPYLEADVVRGFVRGNPANGSILKWHSADRPPPQFQEEGTHDKLFVRELQKGADWEIAFYRSISMADGLILIGGGNATNVVGQVAIGARMPILSLSAFGGAAKKVWDTLSAGEDLPNREELNIMAGPWESGSAKKCVDVLFAQNKRRRTPVGVPLSLVIVAGLLFLAALALIPLIWGHNTFDYWMLFLAPPLAGGAGSAIRTMLDRLRGRQTIAPTLSASVVLGLVAGGIAVVLFVAAQLTADPNLISGSLSLDYPARTILFAVAVGFVAGLTSEAVFGKLKREDIVHLSGLQE